MTTPYDERERQPATNADYLDVQRDAFRALLTISAEAVGPTESAVEQRFAEERDATECEHAASLAKSTADRSSGTADI